MARRAPRSTSRAPGTWPTTLRTSPDRVVRGEHGGTGVPPFFMNKGFEPSLFDKLFDDQPMGAVRRRLSLEQLKDSVARDLEALLNTRVVFDSEKAATFPLTARSVACL